MIDLYQLDDHEAQNIRELAREARKRDGTTPQVAEWAQTYVALESAARELRIFHEELIPRLVQTEAYARELLGQGVLRPERGIDDEVGRRLARQEQIIGPDAPQLTLVLGEAAVHRDVGGPEVRREQLQFLRKLATLPNIALLKPSP